MRGTVVDIMYLRPWLHLEEIGLKQHYDCSSHHCVIKIPVKLGLRVSCQKPASPFFLKKQTPVIKIENWGLSKFS